MLLPATVLSFALLAAPQRPLDLEPIATGLNAPLWVDHAPGDDASRVFVVTQFGKIRIVKDDVLQPGAFLDISSKVNFSGEMGLLGLAFHPNYEQNGFFYVNYSNSAGDTVIERYQVSATDPDLADPNSGFVILTIAQPYSNHNGGWTQFGPDGYLYIGMGDGGSAGDPGNRAQDGNELLGKMLRIDVDNPSPGLNYGIPPSNPFVGDPNVRDEIWSLGLRNPWRCDFDDATGDLWIADVGQNKWEEVDFEPAGQGGRNYGWRIMEGNHCYNPPSGCNQTGLELPIYEYGHSFQPFRCSITGGVVYRGRSMATMQGRYFFSDYCSNETWSFRYRNGQVVDFADHSGELSALSGVVSFGEDADGEMYVCSAGNGTVYRVVPAGLRLVVPQLQAGLPATLDVSGGSPNAPVALAFSLTGLGSTPIPPAGVTLDLDAATAGGISTTDGAGAASFGGTPPLGLQGRTIWFQAFQAGAVSNVVVEVVD